MGRIQGDLKDRTLRFAVQIVDLVEELPNYHTGWEIGKQLVRSGGSVGANVREADGAFTSQDFAYKCSIARREAGETHYWLTVCKQADLLSGEKLRQLLAEAHELEQILTTIVKNTQQWIQENKDAGKLSNVRR